MAIKGWGGFLLWGIAAAAFAQATMTPPPAVGAAAASATVQTDTVKTTVPGAPAPESKAAAGGRANPWDKQPMNIRLQEGGIKAPKCAEESREGLACK
ncbi:MAG: hypothetical protein ABI654_07260 [Betaproteobacteria bacterium]